MRNDGLGGLQKIHSEWSHSWSCWMNRSCGRTQHCPLQNGHLITLHCWRSFVTCRSNTSRNISLTYQVYWKMDLNCPLSPLSSKQSKHQQWEGKHAHANWRFMLYLSVTQKSEPMHRGIVPMSILQFLWKLKTGKDTARVVCEETHPVKGFQPFRFTMYTEHK
jgi:hypothetical protein